MSMQCGLTDADDWITSQRNLSLRNGKLACACSQFKRVWA